MKTSVQRYVPIGFALLSFIIYLFTVAPGVLYIDSGELAAVQATLGVAHPTGYPLFTISGFIWSKIFPFGSIIWRLNILAAIFVAAGNYFFIRTVYKILSEWNFNTAKNQPAVKGKKAPAVPSNEPFPLADLVASLCGFGFIAFSTTYWLQSTSVEVYSLHILLLNGILFSTWKAFFTRGNNRKQWIYVSIWMALGMANHMTTAAIVPAIAFLFFVQNKLNRDSIIKITWMAGTFLIVAVLLYAYLPIRSSMHPALNWGNTHIGEYFWRHFSGKQYQVWMFSSSKIAGKNFDAFLGRMPGEFSYIGLVLLLPGLFYGFVRNKTVTAFFAICIFINIIWVVNYSIKDLEPYFLLALISFAFFISAGIRALLDYFPKIREQKITAAASLVVVAGMVSLNYSSANQSDNHMYDDFVKDALNSVEKDAVILAFQWDVLISPAYYYQYAEGLRSDVLIIDKELMRRSWYFDQLAGIRPEIMDPVKKEKEEFIKALMPFERGQRHNPQLIQEKYVALITSILEKNYRKYPVYVSDEILMNEIQNPNGSVRLPKQTMLVPEKYFYRIYPLDSNASYIPMTQSIEIPIRFNERDGYFFKSVRALVMSVLSNRIGYELAYGKKEEARKIYESLLTIDPKIPAPPGLN